MSSHPASSHLSAAKPGAGVRSLPVRGASLLASLSLLILAAGCATPGGGGETADAGGRVSLPTAFSSRWTPPEFATRPVDGGRAAVIEACVEAANALGYTVSRMDGASGKISAARRQVSAFDGARQDILEIAVTTLAPESSLVALSLREAVESGSGSGIATTSLVRDRAPYDAFFARLTDMLAPKNEAPADPAPVPLPAATP